MKIRSSIENIVHALLRVNTMNKRLPEIFKPVNDTKAEKQRTEAEKQRTESNRTESEALSEEGNTLLLLGLGIVNCSVNSSPIKKKSSILKVRYLNLEFLEFNCWLWNSLC